MVKWVSAKSSFDDQNSYHHIWQRRCVEKPPKSRLKAILLRKALVS